jgi:alpha-tubulin suppressor-like RCC1 family protein
VLLDCAIDEITCGNNHVVAYNNSLSKLYFWGSNRQGQIEIFKKEMVYRKPRILSLGSHVTSFRVLARGDCTVVLCDEDLKKEDFEMSQMPKEDILAEIHELGSNCPSF